MKFPTFGDRDVSVETGKQRETGWIPREKYPEFPMESPKKKEKDGGKVDRCFLLNFFWGGRKISQISRGRCCCVVTIGY